MKLTHKQITVEVCETFGSAFVKVMRAAPTDLEGGQLRFDPSLILAVALVKAEVVPISAMEVYLFSQGLNKSSVEHFTNMIEILLDSCENLIPEQYHDTL